MIRFFTIGTVLFALIVSGLNEGKVGTFSRNYERCSDIPVLIYDETREPIFAEKLVDALKDVSRHVNTNFYFAGYTQELPQSSHRPEHHNKNYVVVALIERRQSDIFPSPEALAAATYFTTKSGNASYKLGVVVIDKAAFGALSKQDWKVRSQLTVLRHELGHIAGFAHSSGDDVMRADVLNSFIGIGQLPLPMVSLSERDQVARC